MLMNKQSNAFHPVTRAFALSGAFIFGVFAVTLLVSSLIALPGVLDVLIGCGRAVLTALLARAFWNAGKYSKILFKCIY